MAQMSVLACQQRTKVDLCSKILKVCALIPWRSLQRLTEASVCYQHLLEAPSSLQVQDQSVFMTAQACHRVLLFRPPFETGGLRVTCASSKHGTYDVYLGQTAQVQVQGFILYPVQNDLHAPHCQTLGFSWRQAPGFLCLLPHSGMFLTSVSRAVLCFPDPVSTLAWLMAWGDVFWKGICGSRLKEILPPKEYLLMFGDIFGYYK